ncbi:hypothetical protein F3Y22_tig00008146pilonHSYRG00173 [Hibiscus syriacus]|uniref:Ubiquitin-like protease family profile domain-containing protein n=1 Tax=Hibiscus syriacus TaxID=106335 RepID=A0A6A3CAM0_HIBSY|nr:hypothetical protein F3Y22_tig00008146pilonHSYRG00173 [Hibiscus syriacus]
MVGEDNISNLLMEEMCANGIGDVNDAPSSSTSTTERKFWPIISGEHLEIEAYAALYSGRTKIMRLIFITDHYDNTAIQLEALRMAYEEFKKGENNQLFREIVQKIDCRLGLNYSMDAACCAMVDRKAEKRKEKLESELNVYRHVIQMCLSVILVSIEMGQFSHLRSYISKAEQTPKALDPPLLLSYDVPSDCLIWSLRSTSLLLGSSKKWVLNWGIQTVKSLLLKMLLLWCSLCTCKLCHAMYFTLQNKLIDNINFRDFLELVPKVRELINYFDSSHYASYLGVGGDRYEATSYYHDFLGPTNIHQQLKQIINAAMILYTAQSGSNKRVSLNWINVLCLRQSGGTECGYYVCKFLKEIVENDFKYWSMRI